MKTVQLLKSLLNCYYKIFRNFMTFCYSILIYLSIFFDIETNRQSKITNEKIERYICIFVNNQQSTVEAANNNDFTSTTLFLFFASKDLYSDMSFNVMDFLNTQPTNKSIKEKL